MATFFLFPAPKLESGLMSSANWAELPGGKGPACRVSKLEATEALLFQSKTKLLPSVYQTYSGFVRGSSDNPSHSFVQWPKVSRQE